MSPWCFPHAYILRFPPWCFPHTYILWFPVLSIISSSHNISSHSAIFLWSLGFWFHSMGLSKWTSQVLTQFAFILGWNSMLGGVYIWLCIPSKITLRVFTEFVSVLWWNSMLRGVYIWLCVFSKIILRVLAEVTSILSRSSMTRGVYVRLCIHSKIVWRVLTSLFWDLQYSMLLLAVLWWLLFQLIFIMFSTLFPVVILVFSSVRFCETCPFCCWVFSLTTSFCCGLGFLLLSSILCVLLAAVSVVCRTFICVVFEFSDCCSFWCLYNPCWGLLPSSPQTSTSLPGCGVSKPIKSGWFSPSGSTSSGIGLNSDKVLFVSWSNISVILLHNLFTSLLIHWIHVGGIEFSISVRSYNLYGLLNSIIPRCLQSGSPVAKLSSIFLLTASTHP